MAITRAAGFPVSNTSSATAPAATWVTVGDLAIIAMGDFSSSAGNVSGISSTKATGWTQVVLGTDATDNFSISLWMATITATGADTITVTWAGGVPASFEYVADELSSGLGSTNVWSVVAAGSLRSASAPFNFPSLTSGSATLQTYWGYIINPNGGTGAGFTFTATATGNTVGWNGALATTTTYQPVGTGTGPSFASAGIISAALSASAPVLPPVIPAEFLLAQFRLPIVIWPRPSASITTLQGSAGSVSRSTGRAAGVTVGTGTGASVSRAVGRAAALVVGVGTAPSTERGVARSASLVVGVGTAPSVERGIARSTAIGGNPGGGRLVSSTVGRAAALVVGVGTAPSVERGVARSASLAVGVGTAPSVERGVARSASLVVGVGTAPSTERGVARSAGMGGNPGGGRLVSSTVGRAAGVVINAGRSVTVSSTLGKAAAVGVTAGAGVASSRGVAKASLQGVSAGSAVAITSTVGVAAGVLVSVAAPVVQPIPPEIVLAQYGIDQWLQQPVVPTPQVVTLNSSAVLTSRAVPTASPTVVNVGVATSRSRGKAVATGIKGLPGNAPLISRGACRATAVVVNVGGGALTSRGGARVAAISITFGRGVAMSRGVGVGALITNPPPRALHGGDRSSGLVGAGDRSSGALASGDRSQSNLSGGDR